MNLRTVAALAALLLATGCGTPYMRPANPAEVVYTPPPGKCLVNVHRPSGYAGGAIYSVFDGSALVGVNKGVQRFQYVCEPGKHILIGRNESWGSAISVVRADLEADRVYDLVVDVSWAFLDGWRPRALTPITASEDRRPQVPQWEGSETVMVLDFAQDVAGWEDRFREANLQAVADFDGGPKKDRLLYLTPQDAR